MDRLQTDCSTPALMATGSTQVTNQSEIDRIDALRESPSEDVQFLLGALSRRTEQAMDERNAWTLLIVRVGKQLGCLGSCFPDGNGHILKAAEKAGKLRDAVRPFCENDGDEPFWDQWGAECWEALRDAYKK